MDYLWLWKRPKTADNGKKLYSFTWIAIFINIWNLYILIWDWDNFYHIFLKFMTYPSSSIDVVSFAHKTTLLWRLSYHALGWLERTMRWFDIMVTLHFHSRGVYFAFCPRYCLTWVLFFRQPLQADIWRVSQAMITFFLILYSWSYHLTLYKIATEGITNKRNWKIGCGIQWLRA
jgi:hypothetical protein